jgi:general stress protein 26
MADDTPSVAKLAELAKDIRIGMLTTSDIDGQYNSRPMAQQEAEFDGDLWFFAERDSRKVRQITANPSVGITLTSNDTWISISGSAEIIRDVEKAKELWNTFVAAWLPQGPEHPSVVLIKVIGDTAEYWDTPGGRIASAVSLIKAKATGTRYEGGENEKVAL